MQMMFPHSVQLKSTGWIVPMQWHFGLAAGDAAAIGTDDVRLRGAGEGSGRRGEILLFGGSSRLLRGGSFLWRFGGRSWLGL